MTVAGEEALAALARTASQLMMSCVVLIVTRGTTEVTESFRLEPTMVNRMYWALLGRWRGKTNRQGMRLTLERIKAELERR